MLRPKGILFDKDGTLFDYHAVWVPANWRAARLAARQDEGLAAELLRISGHDPKVDLVAGGSIMAAANNAEIASHWMQLLEGWSHKDLTAAITDCFNAQIAEGLVPAADLPQLLGGLRAVGLGLGVATADSEEGARHSLLACDSLAYFDFLAGFDSGHGVKPEPDMVWAFCEQLSLQPAAVVVVGDNRHDLEMARAAGAGWAIGVLTGTSSQADLAPLADAVLPSIEDLPAYLGL